MEALDKLR